jgi:hypothetical protein
LSISFRPNLKPNFLLPKFRLSRQRIKPTIFLEFKILESTRKVVGFYWLSFLKKNGFGLEPPQGISVEFAVCLKKFY